MINPTKHIINLKPADRIADVSTYYFATKLQQIAAMNEAGKDVINLGIGSPDLAPPPKVVQQLKSVIEQPINGYQSYTGIVELKKAIANWYKKIYQVEVSHNKNVLPLIGSKEGIFHLSQAFLNSGDHVLVPNPGYPAYSANAKLAGAEAILYPLKQNNNWQPDFEWLEQQDVSKVKMLWCNYPNMPTTAKASIQTFEKLIQFGIDNNILICHDNPYSFILNNQPQSILQINGALQTAIELNSLSKSHHIPGWRIGMMIADEAIIKNVLKVKTNIDSGMYKGLQLAAVEALHTDKEWHKTQNEIYSKRKEKVIELMQHLNCTINTNGSGLFVWGEIPNDRIDAETYSEQILQQCQVFVTPGFIFGTAGKQYLRASLCMPVERIEEAITRIKNDLL